METVYKLQTTDNEPPALAAIRREHPKLKAMSIEKIKTLVQSLQGIVGGFISLQGDIVSLNSTPQKIKDSIHHETARIPREFREAYIKAFDKKK